MSDPHATRRGDHHTSKGIADMKDYTELGEQTPLEGALEAQSLGIHVRITNRREKAILEPGWQDKDPYTSEQLTQILSDGQHNIVGVWGEKSGGIIDVDLDTDEARKLADHFLPITGREFGRAKFPRSHRLYRCHDLASLTFANGTGAITVEVRSDKHATVLPGSEYPDGELCIWGAKGEILDITPEVLVPAVSYLAAAAIILALYPSDGARNEYLRDVVPFLFSMHVPREEAIRLVAAVAMVAGDEEADQRLVSVNFTYDKIESGDLRPGQAALIARIGEPAVRQLRKILGGISDTGIEKAKRQDANAFWFVANEYRAIHAPSRTMWPIESVAKVVPPVLTGYDPVTGDPIYEKSVDYLATRRAVNSVTWIPGEPEIIEGWGFNESGRYVDPDTRVFNLYQHADIEPGAAALAGPWLKHVQLLWPDGWEHIVAWMASRVQQPQVKINHALVLGGAPGIGKDTIIEPFRYAIGEANMGEVSPSDLAGTYNGWAQNVVVRVNEWRDMGEGNRFSLYEHMKTYLAAPPMVLRVHVKYANPRPIPNSLGVLITTNHRSGGLHLPASDRRHFVAFSDVTVDQLPGDHFRDLWTWIHDGGSRHVAQLLRERDLSKFDPKAPPPKTDAFWVMAAADVTADDLALNDALDKLGNPEVVTTTEVIEMSKDSPTSFDQFTGGRSSGLEDFLIDRRNARQVPHRFEQAGYIRVVNMEAKDGAWKIGDKRKTVYGRKDLTHSQHVEAIRSWVSRLQAERDEKAAQHQAQRSEAAKKGAQTRKENAIKEQETNEGDTYQA